MEDELQQEMDIQQPQQTLGQGLSGLGPQFKIPGRWILHIDLLDERSTRETQLYGTDDRVD